MAKKTDTLNYDTAFAELKQIVQDLQSEDTGIEKMSDLIARAKELQEYCNNRLRDIEEKVNKMGGD